MTRTNNQGMGFIGWLQLLFIFLKLLNLITWTWWWVWSPFLLMAVLTVLLAVLLLIFTKD